MQYDQTISLILAATVFGFSFLAAVSAIWAFVSDLTER